MKIWYDARTGKQVRYGIAIAKRLRKAGHTVLLTTREHPDTVALAELLGESFEVVGKYVASSLLARLQESARRMLLFCEKFEDEPPDVCISHRSVESCRIGFGLNIPVISTHDTVHNEVISRLTMPLTDFLVVSKSIPRRFYESYGIARVFRFAGVDEIAWTKNYKPTLEMDYGRPLIVVRQMETKAIYTQGKKDMTEMLAFKLASLGKVVFLPRYDKLERKGLIVPQKFVDSANLAGCADLVLSIGGTMSREAALQGTPSIVIRPVGISYANEYLSDKGFPLFTVDPSEVFTYAKRYIGKRADVGDLMKQMEDPTDTIERITREKIK